MISETTHGQGHQLGPLYTLEGIISKKNPVNSTLWVTPIYPFHTWITNCMQHLKWLDQERVNADPSSGFHNDDTFALWYHGQMDLWKSMGRVNPCMEKIDSSTLKSYKQDPIALNVKIFPNPISSDSAHMKVQVTDKFIKTFNQQVFLEDYATSTEKFEHELGSTCDRFMFELISLNGAPIDKTIRDRSPDNIYRFDLRNTSTSTGMFILRTKGLNCGTYHNQDSIRGTLSKLIIR